MISSSVSTVRRLTIVLLTAALLATACGDDDDAIARTEPSDDGQNEVATGQGVNDDRILVGSIEPLSGPFTDYGTLVKYAMDTYFGWVNDQGGIAGRMVEVVHADDQWDPGQTQGVFRQLVDRDKVALLQINNTTGLAGIRDQVRAGKIPVFSLSTAPVLVDPATPYLFPVGSVINDSGKIAVEWLVEEHGVERIANVFTNDQTGEPFGDGARVAAEALKIAADDHSIPAQATDVEAEVQNILEGDPDAVVVGGGNVIIAQVIRSLRTRGYTSPIVGQGQTLSSNTPELAGVENFENVFCACYIPLDLDSEYLQRYIEIAESQGETPKSGIQFAAMALPEVMHRVLEAAAESGDLTPDGINAAAEAFCDETDGFGKICYGPGTRTLSPNATIMHEFNVATGRWAEISDRLVPQT